MEKRFLNPLETAKAIVEIGIKKANSSKLRMIVLGFLAGAYISLGSHLYTTVTTGISDHVGFGMTKLIGGTVFSVGLILVIVAGAELFTGNCLMPMALWQKKITIKRLLTNWCFVYISNFIGALFVVILIYEAGLNGNVVGTDVVSSVAYLEGLSPVGVTAVEIANAKSVLPFIQTFIRGILANWLVCLAVYMCISSKDITSKILSCIFPVMAFVAMGFEHSVANMYFLPAGLFASKGLVETLTIQSAAINIFAATLGNIIGGAFFVSTLYWFAYLRNEK